MYKGSLHRLVPSRFPPVTLFDWVDSEEELYFLAAIEGLSNDRLRNEVGTVNLLPKNQQIYGPGTSSIMAAFTHVGFPSRFTDGQFGVYYCAAEIETAIAEVKYHRAQFMAASGEGPTSITMREYVNCFVKDITLQVITAQTHAELLDPDSYTESQQFGLKLRQAMEYGLSYPSVRHDGGQCFAVFRPDALQPANQAGHYEFIWDGESISAVFERNVI